MSMDFIKRLAGQALARVPRQFLVFLIIGGLATSLQLILLVIGVEWLVLNVIHASGISYLISALFNYCLNYLYTFNSKQKHGKALTKFMMISLLGVIINALLLKALLLISVNYLFAQIIVIGILLVFNYTVHKYWTYRSSA